jgi:molecular chaperone GrpE (heat shock protein)
MRDAVAPRISKWPFLAGDVLLLGTAYFTCLARKPSPELAELSLAAACILAGAVLAVVPFILEYRALVRLAEADALTTVVSQVQGIEAIAAQIAGATGRWQNVQDEADKAVAAARSIATQMTAEVKAFSEFMQRVNDTEKATLRLEVEKLRRGEQDWLQVLVRLLDHVYALNAGAVRSGQPRLIEQLANFQNACRDSARRVGLVPFVAAPAEAFDPQRHEVVEGDGPGKAPTQPAAITDTVATGYTYQGRLLRHALVRIQPADRPASEVVGTPAPTVEQSQLPLGAPASGEVASS